MCVCVSPNFVSSPVLERQPLPPSLWDAQILWFFTHCCQPGCSHPAGIPAWALIFPSWPSFLWTHINSKIIWSWNPPWEGKRWRGNLNLIYEYIFWLLLFILFIFYYIRLPLQPGNWINLLFNCGSYMIPSHVMWNIVLPWWCNLLLSLYHTSARLEPEGCLQSHIHLQSLVQ